uniref:F-box associated beta-propeller type 3 domain-containing protein n=1 Tax=Chenopodium quinoa TaxID=63459 RepID=A0A803KPU9_CHEQI
MRRADTDDQVGETVFLLWNPATREVFKLPDTDGIESSCAGVGFDDITNNYKVVNFDDTMNSSIVQLYSLAENSWKQVDAGFYFGGQPPETSVSDPTSNGRMHSWILNYEVGYDLSCSLLSFDMADEIFVETPLPDETSELRRAFLQQSSNDKYPTLYSFDDGSCIKESLVSITKCVRQQPEHGPRGGVLQQEDSSLGMSLIP